MCQQQNHNRHCVIKLYLYMKQIKNLGIQNAVSYFKEGLRRYLRNNSLEYIRFKVLKFLLRFYYQIVERRHIQRYSYK